VPDDLAGKITIISGALDAVIGRLNGEDYERLYIDGAQLIKALLLEDKIDRMIIVWLPVLLGGGISLFGPTHAHLNVETRTRDV